MKTKLTPFLLVVTALSVAHLSAQVPQLINYQGRVAVDGVNYDGAGQFKFALVGPPTVATQATAVARMTGLVLRRVDRVTVLTPGFGYLSAPKVSFSGGGGSGAAALAAVAGGRVTGFKVTDEGGGYTAAPDVFIGPPTRGMHQMTYWSNDGSSSLGSQPRGAIALTVTKGLYSVSLGDITLANMVAIPASVFGNPDVRLRVWFNDGANGWQLLTPDQRIAAVGYAMMAGGLQPGTDISAGSITATSFSGNGSGLTNLATAPAGMVLIPAGAFTMGNTVAADTDITDAAPVSTTVSAFYMDVTEVTLSQWQSVYYWAKDNGYTDLPAGTGKAANHPVHTVSWYACVKWCNARSEQAGLTPVYYTDDAQTTIYKTGNVNVTNVQVNWSADGYRLPTEAEREKAARGGLSGQRFPWGNTISQNLANYYGVTGSYAYDQGPNGYNPIGAVGGTSPATSPVGSFAANGYGLHDMAGNMYEWCWDWYPAGTDKAYAGGTDPHGATTGSRRVLRGGGWGSSAYFTRCALRDYFNPGNAYDYFGFRAVLAPGQ